MHVGDVFPSTNRSIHDNAQTIDNAQASNEKRTISSPLPHSPQTETRVYIYMQVRGNALSHSPPTRTTRRPQTTSHWPFAFQFCPRDAFTPACKSHELPPV